MFKDNFLSAYTLELSEEQAKLISLALDMYSRMESGQLDSVFNMISWKYSKNLVAARPLLDELQKLLTGMVHGNLGIGNVSEKAKMAYDLHQVIRHRLAWDKNPRGDMTVDFDEPRQYSNEPLANIKKIDLEIKNANSRP